MAEHGGQLELVDLGARHEKSVFGSWFNIRIFLGSSDDFLSSKPLRFRSS